MDRNIRRMQLQLVLEETRRILVHAMIRGLVVVVRLGDIVCDLLTFNDEHCDQLDPLYEATPPFTKLAYVPSEWVLNGGNKLKTDNQWPQRMYRRLELGE